ncbi:MAG: hypothetical protein JWO51_3231 [Rhodospirillales bacterium]|nr:hypothetical protein [Rhodospirillales bacterium]
MREIDGHKLRISVAERTFAAPLDSRLRGNDGEKC